MYVYRYIYISTYIYVNPGIFNHRLPEKNNLSILNKLKSRELYKIQFSEIQEKST